MRTTTTSNSSQLPAMWEDTRMNRGPQSHSAESTHEGGDALTLWKSVRFRLLLWHAKGLSSTWCCFATFFLHVQQGGFAHTLIHGIKQPTHRCIEVKCLCIHMLAGLLDTNFDDCGGREEGCVQTLCCAFFALFKT